MRTKNIKKFIFILVAFLICPAFVFSACTKSVTIVEFQVKSTDLEILNFYNNVRSKTNNFIDYVPKVDELTLPQQNIYEDTISTIQDIENRIYLTVPALDFHLNNDEEVEDESEYYAFEDLDIWDFELIENFKIGNIKTYSKNITGENESEYLPVVAIADDDNNCKDFIDDIIINWGNALVYNVETAINNVYKIEVTTGFYYPNAFEVPEKNDGEMIITRSETMKQIIITYSMNTGIELETFSKVITFSSTDKIIKKYKGVYSPEATPIGQYKYEIENSAITGRYEIEFLPNTGYFKAKYYPVLNEYSDYFVFECFDLANDILISRLHSVSRTGVGENVVLSYDFYVSSSGVDGRIKLFDVANLGYINNITNISISTFAQITEAEKRDIDNKKVAFNISNGQTYCQTVGY
ncbi:MAG: hypothetical protein PHI76_00820 [Clostridia bacterium]|nr:hypothetical protein [Clostridia bacterium]